MTEDIKKILILRLSSLGDIALTTPVIKAVKLKFPQAKIFFLTKSKYAPLLVKDPNLVGIIEFNKDKAGGLFGTLQRIRNERFDLVIDLHSNLRSFFLRNFSKAKLKLKYNKRWLSRFIMVHFKKIKISPQHTVDSYLDCLKKIDIYSADKIPRLYVDEQSKKSIGKFIKNISEDEILIGIVPGAKWESKRWGEANFAETIKILNNKIKAKFALIGGKEDEELIKNLKQLTGNIEFIEAVDLPFSELLALIGNCRIVLTNDSGPMHLAVGLNVPVVAIFGPTHPKLGFAPLGKKDLILCADVECSPCSLHGERKCYKESKICMEKITPETVADKAMEILKNKEKIW